MRVSLPIRTVALPSPGTRPIARPRRNMNSGVIGSTPARPRMPSVPKYFLAVIKYRAGSAWLHRVRWPVGIHDAGQQRFDLRPRGLAIGRFVELHADAGRTVALPTRRRDPHHLPGDRQAVLVLPRGHKEENLRAPA